MRKLKLPTLALPWAFLILTGAYLKGQQQYPVKSLKKYYQSHHQEKIYLNHDKPYYAPGDTLWCKIHLLDGTTHQVFDAQPIVYADWIDPEGAIQQSWQLKIVDGFASLEIATTPLDTTGHYKIRAYTQYQKNFAPHFLFQKEIPLIEGQEEEIKLPTDDDFSIQFFPEGGQLVTGLSSTVAFKAQNSRGAPISVNGVIVDNHGQTVAPIKAIHQGMGRFEIEPRKNTSYSITLLHGKVSKTFPLPPALPAGFTLKINTRDAEQISIRVGSNTKKQLDGAMLVGHVRGQVFLERTFTPQAEKGFLLNKTGIPSGLVHFTLFDAEQRPVCERLVFNLNRNEIPETEILLDADEYGQRDPVKVTISNSKHGAIIPSQFSVSVYNNDVVKADLQHLDIVNYLLLQSDLPGRIRNIQQYFLEDNGKTRVLMDLVLLTHGWRRFRWTDVLAQKRPDLLYPAEQDFSIAGKITKKDKDVPVRADVSLSVLSDENFSLLNLTTEEDGLFYFKGFDFRDTTDVLLQASIHNSRKKKRLKDGEIKQTGNRNVDIELFNFREMAFNDSISFRAGQLPEAIAEEFATATIQSRKVDSIYNPEWSIDLDEITVRARLSPGQIRENRIAKEYEKRGLFYFSSSQKFLMDNPIYENFQYTTIYDLIRTTVPRAKVIRNGPVQKVILGRLSSGTEAAIALDGKLVSFNFLETIDPHSIAIVDILTGFYASGLYGTDPVIALVSKDPSEVAKPQSGILNLQHPGYYQAREFYCPDYELSPVTNPKPDYRTTLFWDPDISITDRSAEIRFFTGDQPGTYLIWIEGLTEDGVPFTQRQTFSVFYE